MDFSSVVSAISSVGFPIVVCLICFAYINKNIEVIRVALDNNTRVMSKFCERTNIDEKEVIKNDIK